MSAWISEGELMKEATNMEDTTGEQARPPEAFKRARCTEHETIPRVIALWSYKPLRRLELSRDGRLQGSGLLLLGWRPSEALSKVR